MDDLDDRIDALFDGPPGDFTAGRDALARELRDAGDREAADRVKVLRRPTRLAAELNRIAREHVDDLAALVAAEEGLAEAQEAMVAGTGTAADLHDAGEAEAAALAALSPDTAVRAALRAAARTASLRDDLLRGRLTADPGLSAGDGLFASAAAPAARAAPATPRKGKASAPPPEPGPDAPPDELAAARRRRAREAALAEARRLVEAAGDAETEAAAAHEGAAARATAAREQRDRAATALDEARRALTEAEAAEVAARAREALAAAEDD